MRKSIILVILSIIGGTSMAQTYSLEEAVAYALNHNEQMKQAEIDVQISQAKVRETTSIGLPQVNAEASANYFIDIPTQVAPPFDLGIPGIPAPDPNDLQEFQFGLPYSASAGITANQLLFDGSYFVGLKASKAYLNYARLAQEKSEIEVRTAVAQTYFAAAALSKSYNTLVENERTLQQSVSETIAMYDAGFMEKQDFDQVKLSLANLQYQKAVILRQRDQFERLLKLQMGLNSEAPITLSDDFDQLIGAMDRSFIDPAFNVENHIDFRTVLQGEELSELSLASEKTKSLPQLAAFATHSQNGFSQDLGDLFSNEFYPTTIIGLQLNVPLFASGMRYYKTKQAKLELEKTQSQKRLLQNNLETQAFSAKQNYSSALENIQLAEDNLALAEQIKATTEKKYKEGLASSLDFAQAESQYLNSLNAYISIAQELFNAKLELDKALGNN